jgi:hypothetical protein
MAKTWVLDTATKGTGASMVPLESILRDPDAKAEPLPVAPRPRPRAEPEPQPLEPRRFKVVDVMTRQTLGEGDVRRAVDLLRNVRSLVDVNLYVWDPTRDAWRLLSLRDTRALWDFRER